MSQTITSRFILVAMFLTTLVDYSKESFNSQPKFIIKAQGNQAFHESCQIGTFHIRTQNIAECLEQCLQDCRCQSFQICQNTKCQLCSSHKEENSSLLREENGCVYATYEMRQSTTVQNYDDRCSAMSCSMNDHCCEQPGLCPDNKICKAFNSPAKPWKRYTCVCPDGYHGNECDVPITSCLGYAESEGKSGMYKVVDSASNSLYEVYCHFGTEGTWTLVMSNSFQNQSSGLKETLTENLPVNEDALTWGGYRLSKARMESIRDNSTFLQFTCDYEKHRVVALPLDHVRIPFADVKVNNMHVDVLELKVHSQFFPVVSGRGKIGGEDLHGCQVKLHQRSSRPLHVHVKSISAAGDSACKISGFTCFNDGKFFDSFFKPSCGESCDCDNIVHRCMQNNRSTTQLWFGLAP